MYIDQNLQKALSDRVYEKRKPAALQLEQNVRKAVEQGEMGLVEGVITELSRDFAYALRHPNYRNGGLIGLAAVAIALGQDSISTYLDDILQPILACFGDADARVRYYACEALYNVAKIAKGEILAYFNEIFDALCKLTADVEDSVRNGANLVDQLLRDIVVETAATYLFVVNSDPPQIDSPVEQPFGEEGPTLQRKPAPDQRHVTFSLERFIPLLVERIYVMNPATRMFLVQWIMLLDSIPDLELVKFVPEFLEGLLLFLGDAHKDVRTFTKTCLETLLREIQEIARLKRDVQQQQQKQQKQDQQGGGGGGINAGAYRIGQDTFIYYSQIVEILLGKMDPLHDETQHVVLDWLEGMLNVSPTDVFAKLSSLLTALLPALSDERIELKRAGNQLSEKLLAMLPEQASAIDVAAAIHALGRQLDNVENKVTRLAALQWIAALYAATHQISGSQSSGSHSSGTRSDLLARLLYPLSDPSDEVVAQDLDVLALILKDAETEEFDGFVDKMVGRFRTSQQLFAHRGKFVCLQLCLQLSPERVFRAFAKVVVGPSSGSPATKDKNDEDFDCLLIQNLSNILLTAPELHAFRNQLTELHTPEGVDLFTTLFRSWKRNSVATLSLCLLAQAYDHAFDVLEIISKLDVTVSTLIRIDRLVQLIEGPVFAPLRMHLLWPHKYHYLYKTLYGLLMVLPQSKAFTILQTRLSSVSGFAQLPVPASADCTSSNADEDVYEPSCSKVDWEMLHIEFKEVYNHTGT